MRRSSLMSWTAGLALGVTVSSCITPILPGKERVVGRGAPSPTTPTASPGDEPVRGLGRKAVNGKEPPNVLIAIDGTKCRTSEKTWSETRIGQRVLCRWTAD